jgi:hypothetical protein
MKLGTQDRRKVLAAVVLFGLGIVLALRAAEYSPRPRGAAHAAAAHRPQHPARPAAKGPTGPTALPVLTDSPDPRLRLDLLRASEGVEYKPQGGNIFEAGAEIPQPVAPGTTDHAGGTNNAADRQPAGPPPIDLRFYGFASAPGQPKKVFLAQGDNIYIGGEGDIIGRRYRILHIGPNSVEVEDILHNNRQTLPLAG